jgi:hypothetical protein
MPCGNAVHHACLQQNALHFAADPSQHGRAPCWAAARWLLNAKREFATLFSHFSPVPYGPSPSFLAAFARDFDLLLPL